MMELQIKSAGVSNFYAVRLLSIQAEMPIQHRHHQIVARVHVGADVMTVNLATTSYISGVQSHSEH
jgi:hypothetical protein